jgi:hypothetical protein
MRTLTAVLLLFAAASLLGDTTIHRETSTNGRRTETTLHLEGDGDEHEYATWEHNGARFITRDPGVLAEIRAALKKYSGSRDHAELGRKHAALGRDHEALGREHERLARELERGIRAGNAEAAQREFDRKQKDLELRQQELERKQQGLEREQRRLESQQRASEREADKAIDAIFSRALEAGKAQRR